MCRIAGYLGPEITLGALLSDPPHALRVQGRTPRELPPGLIGGDGYGVAWYVGGKPEPARYRQTLPIWSDANLDELAPNIASACIVASTRTAIAGMPVAITNTPPFRAGDAVLVHNGSIARFHATVAEPLRAALAAEARVALHGNSDSEYIAAWLRCIAGRDLRARVRSLIAQLTELIQQAGTTAQLNLIVADGRELVAVRHALGDHAPTLYMATRPDGGTVVCSEPLDEDETWVRVADHTLLSVTHGRAPTLEEVA
jgi:gamma-glutamyl hercynylcysteine S-oxide hydrolase